MAEARTPAPEAVTTKPDDERVGTAGLVLAGAEIGGGAVREADRPEETAPPEDGRTRLARIRSQAARSGGFTRLLALSGRGVTEVGLFTKGDTIAGHMILLNTDTLEKVRFTDQKIEEDGVFANTRDLADSLVTGDVKDALKAAEAR